MELELELEWHSMQFCTTSWECKYNNYTCLGVHWEEMTAGGGHSSNRLTRGHAVPHLIGHNVFVRWTTHHSNPLIATWIPECNYLIIYLSTSFCLPLPRLLHRLPFRTDAVVQKKTKKQTIEIKQSITFPFPSPEWILCLCRWATDALHLCVAYTYPSIFEIPYRQLCLKRINTSLEIRVNCKLQVTHAVTTREKLWNSDCVVKPNSTKIPVTFLKKVATVNTYWSSNQPLLDACKPPVSCISEADLNFAHSYITHLIYLAYIKTRGVQKCQCLHKPLKVFASHYFSFHLERHSKFCLAQSSGKFSDLSQDESARLWVPKCSTFLSEVHTCKDMLYVLSLSKWTAHQPLLHLPSPHNNYSQVIPKYPKRRHEDVLNLVRQFNFYVVLTSTLLDFFTAFLPNSVPFITGISFAFQVLLDLLQSMGKQSTASDVEFEISLRWHGEKCCRRTNLIARKEPTYIFE